MIATVYEEMIREGEELAALNPHIVVKVPCIENGIKAIWNFAHTDLNLPDNIIVENVHLSESLMRLSYNITRYNEEHEGK